MKLPSVVLALLSVLTATPAPAGNASCPYGADQCRPGWVWREAWAADHVCVDAATRQQVAADNLLVVARRVPPGSAQPDICLPGFVWREAGPQDRVCVTGTVRSQAARDNA